MGKRKNEEDRGKSFRCKVAQFMEWVHQEFGPGNVDDFKAALRSENSGKDFCSWLHSCHNDPYQ